MGVNRAGALLLLLSGLLGAGCSTTSRFSAISSKNVNLTDIQAGAAQSKGRATGEDCSRVFLFFSSGGPPTLDEAIDQAVESLGGNLLMKATVRNSWFAIPPLYFQNCWYAEGDVYDTYK